MCAPSLVRAVSFLPSPKSNVGVQLPPLSVRIAVFLPSASLWDSWVRRHLACACPHLACARPHLACQCPHLACGRPHLARVFPHFACARPHLACAHPHLCAPSLSMCAPSLVRALTWHVRALSVRPSPKSNVGVQLPPLSMRIAVFLPSATLWDSWVRPHLACVRPHLACARPHFACGHPHWACARPLRPSLSKKQCRCPTTPFIHAYCCLFAFRYLVG
jgi:hypothetical protein